MDTWANGKIADWGYVVHCLHNALHQDNIARETWPASKGSGPYTSTQGSSDGQVGKWILVQFGKWQIGALYP